MPLSWTKLRPSLNLMKPKTYLLFTKHDFNAFIELPCGAICFCQCNLWSRGRFEQVQSNCRRHPGGSGWSKMNRDFPYATYFAYFALSIRWM